MDDFLVSFYAFLELCLLFILGILHMMLLVGRYDLTNLQLNAATCLNVNNLITFDLT